MVTDITEEEFGELLGSFRRSAFRFETLPAYAMSYERADFDRFLAGQPVPPPEIDWWRDWLDQSATHARAGRSVSRVRVLAEPPTDYQRWMIWAHPWYDQAREKITYLPESRAVSLGLPLGVDWWLLDDQRLVLMYFSETGEVAGKLMVTEPGIVARHREWRDLAVRNASPAGETAAA